MVDVVLKEAGFRYSTLSGVSIGMDDLTVPEIRGKLIDEAEAKAIDFAAQYQQGLITNDELLSKDGRNMEEKPVKT